MKPGDIVEVEIHDIAFGGDGVARHEGRVIFIPYAAPQEQLKVRITRVKKDYAHGEISELIRSGTGRCEPKCRYYRVCGGCQYQHLEYETQLAIKEKQLRDVLGRIGGIQNPNILQFLKSPQPYGYRNRISVHQEDERVGFRGCDGRSLVEVEECVIASVEVNRKLRYLRSHPGRREHYSLREDEIPREGFYQTNRFLLDPLRELVALQITAGAPLVIECYGGAGFFTPGISEKAKRVILVESDAKLAQEARGIAAQNVEVREVECEEVLPEFLHLPELPDAEIVVDPPREGLSSGMRKLLAGFPARKLIYLSCNPSTLARDLKEMAPHWKPLQFQPVDLFPQTAHFECLAVCERSEQAVQ